MSLTFTEENYLKAILRLSTQPDMTVSTNALAVHLHTSAASITDMLKKLSGKKLITYQKYNGARLTEQGNKQATYIVRKHRLWEVFLVQSLGMTWDEVHDIAEELEHISSDHLIDRLDAFLGFPKFDPHGDPIPNALGKYTLRSQTPLAELETGQTAVVVGLRESGNAFLQHLSEKGIAMGTRITLLQHDPYDQSIRIEMNQTEMSLSGQAAQNLLVKVIVIHRKY